MAQDVVTFSGDPTGTQLLDTLLTGLQNNSLTTNSGTARPSYAQTGTIWLDITTTPWLLKVFNGTSDIVLGAISTEFALNALAANSIVCNPTASVANSSTLTLGANKFPARDSTGNIAAKTVTDFALTLLDDIDQAAARATLGIDAAQANTGAMRLLAVANPSGASFVDFTGVFSSDYVGYDLRFNGLKLSNLNAELRMRFSDTGTSDFRYGGSDYAYNNLNLVSENNISYLLVGKYPGSINAWEIEGIHGSIRVNAKSGKRVTADWVTSTSSNTGPYIFGSHFGHGFMFGGGAAQLDGIRLLPSAGSLSGTVCLYGLKGV